MDSKTTTIRHFHLFCGMGGGAKGFNAGHARVGQQTARFECVGGIDNNASALCDFKRLTGTPGTCMDLMDAEQYRAWHGAEPPKGWRAATPADIRRAATARPNILFMSAPCKGFSGLLSEDRSKGARYQALNRLTLRGVWLALEAWQHDPPQMVLFENVPRIQNRGRELLDQVVALLRHYGYAVSETAHDCGALGGLGQSRRRFLLVARHQEKVPPFLYEPRQRRLKAVGDVLQDLPVPDNVAGGPMHRVPSLQWRTWVRLAFVEAGRDWRSLENLRVHDGVLTDYAVVPDADYHQGVLGVHRWDDAADTITGRSGPTNGAFSVADPRRAPERAAFGQFGVKRWDEVSTPISGRAAAGSGPYSVADPRIGHRGKRFNNVYRVIPWDDYSPSVNSGGGPTSGGYAVAGARPGEQVQLAHDEPSGHDADARLPGPQQRGVYVIRALDGTWHRPFTTLELATLQGLVDPGEDLVLDGHSDGAWRERVGNAVPAPAAQEIAGKMGETLLLAWQGEMFHLDSTPIWVRPLAVAVSVDDQGDRAWGRA